MDDNNPLPSPSPSLNPQLPPKATAADISVDSPGNMEGISASPTWERFRKFLACNPFYLVSAALLLYSFYLVSVDRSFLPSEVGQLSFNLGSLQLYQILLAGTAIFLAGRAVWYDSTLLIGLENLLLLVPFILISQAALIDARLVWILCFGAALLAAGRMALVRRFISKLNFPSRLAWFGVFVLVVNAALPVVYRVLHESKFGTKPDWGAAYETNQYVWWVLVPAVCVLLGAVPWARTDAGTLLPQRRWLPLGFFGLWLIGTGVHLYCLGYVYDFALRPELLAPAVWTLVWVFYLKLDELWPGLEQNWKSGVVFLALPATLLAAAQPEKAVFLILTAMNLCIFAANYLRKRNPVALHFALISLVALVGGLPEAWGRNLVPQFSRETFIGGAVVVYLLICIALTRNPKLGILGGLAAAISVGIGASEPDAFHWAVQAGLVFLLLHSLRWADSDEQGAGLVRWIVAAGWVAHSLAWTHLYGGGWKTGLMAMPVIAAWVLFRFLHGSRGPLVILLASVLVVLSAPGHIAAAQLESTPAGLLAVIGSFALFGLGTLGAITKHRWSVP